MMLFYIMYIGCIFYLDHNPLRHNTESPTAILLPPTPSSDWGFQTSSLTCVTIKARQGGYRGCQHPWEEVRKNQLSYSHYIVHYDLYFH